MNSTPNFNLVYDTREKSEIFLENIGQNLIQKYENIDFYFMANAYDTIQKWFKEKITTTATNMRTLKRNFENLFTYNVQIIWYEVDNSENSTELFTRLNIGKIPLTNAELVKAMFLSRSNENLDHKKQEEIAVQWDNLEKELHDNALWYFLTNVPPRRYQTRIDLLLDLISSEAKGTIRDPYYTFFYFDSLKAHETFEDLWQKILQTFWQLKDWYENHEFYHKIGYLIACGMPNIDLSLIYRESLGKTKRQFLSRLDELIKETVALFDNRNYCYWNYENDALAIRRLLLLFNVESVRRNGEQAFWFPFYKFKYDGKKKVIWSLEHIHAVSSQRGNEDMWREWLKIHKKYIQSMHSRTDKFIIDEIDELLSRKEFGYVHFGPLQEKIIQKFSPKDEKIGYIHYISNLALLKYEENSALNNSTFAIKRNSIIEMDMHGEFIPFCTKMVFLKYYTKSENNQIQYWAHPDRVAYLEAINEVLKDYLQEPVNIDGEGV